MLGTTQHFEVPYTTLTGLNGLVQAVLFVNKILVSGIRSVYRY